VRSREEGRVCSREREREGVCAAIEKKEKLSINEFGFNRAAKREGPTLERGCSPRKKRREKGVRAVEREEEVQPHRERRERCRRVSQPEKEKRIERVNVCVCGQPEFGPSHNGRKKVLERRCLEIILSQKEKVSRKKRGFNKEVQLGQQVERPECCKRIGGW
jgi:hypothetical protein